MFRESTNKDARATGQRVKRNWTEAARLMHSRAMQIGERLRIARQEQNLSLRALGELTGFSASFLSQVELGQSSPSLGSLQRIAEALGLTVSALLAPDSPARPEAIVRRGSRSALRSEWSNATVESLVPPAADEKLQSVLVRLESGGRTGAMVYAPGRRLFVYCISGKCEVSMSEPEASLALTNGDTLLIDGPRTVRWENRDTSVAELIVVTAKLA